MFDRMTLPQVLTSAFRPRPIDAHKYSVGTVAVVGGSHRYAHAPVIAGLGARAGGAGLVQLVVPETSRLPAAVHVPEATVTELEPTVVPPRADVLVVGMGLGTGPAEQALLARLLSGNAGRFVLDADALTILAGWFGKGNACRPSPGQEFVLTPHEGEAARLLGWTREQVAADRRAAIAALVDRYGATVVLKGARTLVMSADDARLYENETGNPFMALGGMGDLLAGTLGARWAYLKGDPFLAAAAAVWLHGAAGDALVAAARDPSIVNTASSIGSLRVRLERTLTSLPADKDRSVVI